MGADCARAWQAVAPGSDPAGGGSGGGCGDAGASKGDGGRIAVGLPDKLNLERVAGSLKTVGWFAEINWQLPERSYVEFRIWN